MSDPVEEILKTLDVPESLRQNEIRAAFLAEAAKLRAETVSQADVVRHRKRTRFHRRFNQGVLFMRKHWAMAASTTLVMFVLTGIVVGQEIIDFFKQDSDDQITVNVYTAPLKPEITPLPNLPLEEAVASMPFEIFLPAHLPGNFQYDPVSARQLEVGKRLMITFTCSDQGLAFEQHRLSSEDILTIQSEVGASATVENVTIGEVTGQYVKGWWHSTHSLDTTSVQPGTPIPMDLEWNNTLEFYRLYWYQDGMLYSIQSWGGVFLPREHIPVGCQLEKDELVAMANSLKPASEVPYGD